jgi:hypothetical protein
MLLVKDLEHFAFLNDQHGGRGNRGRGAHPNGLTCQTAFAKEVARFQDGDDRLFADFIYDGEFYTAGLQVHYAISGIPLRVDDRCSLKLLDFSGDPGRVEKGLGIERALWLEFFPASRLNKCYRIIRVTARFAIG